MQLTLTIEEEHVSSLETYLQTQQIQQIDELTGRPSFVPKYADVEDFLISQIGEMVNGIVQQYPTQTMRTKMLEIKRLQEEMQTATRPKKADAVERS